MKKFFLNPLTASSFLVLMLKATLFLKKGGLSPECRLLSNLDCSFSRGDLRIYYYRLAGAPVGNVIVLFTLLDGL